MPLNIKIKKANSNKTVDIDATIVDAKAYIDWISELDGIKMHINDTLTLSWNVSCHLSIDRDLKDVKEIKISQTFEPKKDINVRFARLVHYKNKSRIYVYEKLPKLSFPEDD